MNIPDKAIEAAVNAQGRRNNPKWDNAIFGYEQFSEDQRAFLREQAQAILAAAAPFIAAQALHDAATEFDQTDPIETALDTSYPVHWLRARAAGDSQ